MGCRGLFTLLVVSLLVVPLFAQRPSGHRRRVPRSPASSETSAYKAILEPVNYSKDIKLTDVFFVNADTGWVAGEHATILKTTDGGATWTAQVGGDTGNNDPAIGQLRFLDERHGWAIENGSRLLRTRDGQNWEEVKGEFPRGTPVIDYAFTSVDHGILLGGNGDAFYVTNDGGEHWQSIRPCELSVTVQGLAQTPNCHFIKLQMLSARSGLALAWWGSTKDDVLVFFRTDDAGEHWSYVVPDVVDSRYADAFFTDLNHGVVIFNNDRKTSITTDGGRTWRTLLSGGITLDSGGPVRFADPEVGWALGHSTANRDAFRISFTTDGGQHWQNSRDIAFPGNILTQLTFSFPRRDRAYIVGPHGMVYRYRVVPASYAAANALPAPLMPGFDTTPLTEAAARISSDVQKLQAQLAAAGGATNTAAPAGTSSAATNTEMAQGPAPDAAAPSGGFVQDVDSSPPSPQLQSCCSSSLQNLQSDLTTFNQVAPAITTRYRSLNLAIAGFQLIASMGSQARSMVQSFRSLKHAPSLQAATTLLQQLSTALNSTQQAATTGLQDPGGWYATTGAVVPSAPGTFQQDAGPGAAAQPPHP
jgi:photosystem II stability/assembly factor-like uncharacterized protein